MVWSFLLFACLLLPHLAQAWGDIDLAQYNGNRYDLQTASILIRTSGETMYIAMQAVGGYVAAGLNPKEGEMPGADIVVCGDYNNELTATDYHSTAYAQPQVDAEQDWTAIHIGRSDGRTYCEISRPLLTCERSDDFQVHVPSKMVAVMLAWGANDALHYHGGSKGWRYMAFKPGASEAPANETMHTLQIVAPEITLPPVEGVELCSYHLLPGVDPDTNYHITRVRTWWDATAGLAYDRGMAHHITLMACPQAHLTWQDGQMLSSCNDGWYHCNNELVGQAVSIDPNEGIAFGKGVAVAVVFLRHFYPFSQSGVVDRGTTFELQYTPELRPVTLGRLFIQTHDLVVPSNTLDHHVRVWYPGLCSQRNGRVNITSVNIHMHDRGNSDARGAIVHHIRNGVELAPLLEMDSFVEGTSSEGWFQVDRGLEPGDDIFFECIYDNPSSVTERWGSGFNDQMCVLAMDTRTTAPLASSAYLDQGAADTTSPFTAVCPVNTFGGLYPEMPDSIDFTASQRQQLFDYTPYIPPLSCAPAPGVPEGSIILSAYRCDNGYPAAPSNQAHGVNQVYLYSGTTRDGRPYFQGRDTAKHHIFYDENCGGGEVGSDGKPLEAWRSGWFIGCGAPSLNASSNLQGATTGDCCNTASIQDESMQVPIGRRSWWRWCGNQEDSGRTQLNINWVEPPRGPSPSPTPGVTSFGFARTWGWLHAVALLVLCLRTS